MQYIWQPEDIKCGVMYHRGFDLDRDDIPSQRTVEYAMSCFHKIGYLLINDPEDGPLYDKDEGGNRLHVSTSLTDGLTMGMGNAEEVAASLNEGGYKRTTKAEALLMIEREASAARLL